VLCSFILVMVTKTSHLRMNDSGRRQGTYIRRSGGEARIILPLPEKVRVFEFDVGGGTQEITRFPIDLQEKTPPPGPRRVWTFQDADSPGSGFSHHARRLPERPGW